MRRLGLRVTSLAPARPFRDAGAAFEPRRGRPVRLLKDLPLVSQARVSIVVPTRARPRRHRRLYQLFANQTHAGCELLVFEDGDQPSPFFTALGDPRVRYRHSTQALSLGEKRNWLALEASGDVLVHFDDDDYYGPTYVEQMVAALGEADLVKLSGFHIYSLGHDVLSFWDQTSVAATHVRLESGRPLELFHTAGLSEAQRERWRLDNLLGYGFSYVYRRALWERVAFPPVGHGEDRAFVIAALEAGAAIHHVSDRAGLALVLRHARDHSILFPQEILPHEALARIFGRDGEAFVRDAIDAPTLPCAQ